MFQTPSSVFTTRFARRRRECHQLIQEAQKAEGRESAMSLASKQNTHLLRLLEQEEAKRTVLDDDKER